MKKVVFIGAFDKSNFIIYTAKLLEMSKYKILIVDATSSQKLKYIVPSINPTKAYITSFENMDFAVGFESWGEIERYLGIQFDTNDENIDDKDEDQENAKDNLYDYVLIDVDEANKIEAFGLKDEAKNYFVTSFDMYSLRKGIDALQAFDNGDKITKILFSYESYKEDEEYLNHLSVEYNIEWNEYTIYFQILGDNNKVFEENQKLEKIRYKRLGINYKESLAYVVQDIDKKINIGNIKRLMKE